MDCSRDVSVYNDYSVVGLGDTAAHNQGEYGDSTLVAIRVPSDR